MAARLSSQPVPVCGAPGPVMGEQGQQEAPGPWTGGHKQLQEEERCSPGEPLAPAWALDYSDYGEADYAWQSACASLEEVRRIT